MAIPFVRLDNPFFVSFLSPLIAEPTICLLVDTVLLKPLPTPMTTSPAVLLISFKPFLTSFVSFLTVRLI